MELPSPEKPPEQNNHQEQGRPPPPQTPVDPHVWLACAMPLSRLPAVHARVYYMPEGHCEQCSSPAALPPLPASRAILCTVASVRCYGDPVTDEVFASVSLLPGDQPLETLTPTSCDQMSSSNGNVEVKYFAKQLTPSDANNGGGFSVPRYCADHILPPLDFEADPPVQTLSLHDLQGRRWDFRHIYRGTPRRHLLTTGWSRFVNAKKLVARDTVVFMRRGGEKPQLLVGIRRSPRYAAGWDVRARVPAAAVESAALLAADGKAFEVEYYPRQSAGEFLVPQEEVDAALRVVWAPGLQVRMRVMEAEDSQRVEWASGTVKALAPHSNLTPWRMLEVNWDESTSSLSMKSRFVSPWQVQVLEGSPLSKKPRVSEIIDPLGSGDCNTVAPVTGSGNLVTKTLFPLVPAGMQGARHHGPTDVPCDHSEVVNPDNGSPTNVSVNSYPSDLSNERRSIQLFGKTVTFPPTANNGSAEGPEVAHGVHMRRDSTQGASPDAWLELILGELFALCNISYFARVVNEG